MATQVDIVYRKIRERILNQEYLPSQTLTESGLADEFEVSRNTVRKALDRLTVEKLVIQEANKSARIKFLTKDEAFQLLEIRERLEGLVTYSAAKNISDEQIKTMKDLLVVMKEELDKNDKLEYSRLNDVIHNILDDACTNKEALNLARTIRLQLRSYSKKAILIEGRGQESFKEHIELMDALEKKDPDQSEMLMRKHMKNVSMTLMKYHSMLF